MLIFIYCCLLFLTNVRLSENNKVEIYQCEYHNKRNNNLKYKIYLFNLSDKIIIYELFCPDFDYSIVSWQAAYKKSRKGDCFVIDTTNSPYIFYQTKKTFSDSLSIRFFSLLDFGSILEQKAPIFNEWPPLLALPFVKINKRIYKTPWDSIAILQNMENEVDSIKIEFPPSFANFEKYNILKLPYNKDVSGLDIFVFGKPFDIKYDSISFNENTMTLETSGDIMKLEKIDKYLIECISK